MKKYISMRDHENHCTWEIPIALLAMKVHTASVAKLVANNLPVDEAAVRADVEDFLSDPVVLVAVAREMQWQEIVECARMVQWNQVDPKPAHPENEWSDPYDDPVKTEMPASRSSVTAAPVNLFMSLAYEQGDKITSFVLTNENRATTGAFVMIEGDEQMVQACLYLLAQLAEQFKEHPDGRVRRPYKH